MEKDEEEAVEVADRGRHVGADDRRRLGGVLRQHLGDLDEAHQIGRSRAAVLQRLGIEDVDAGRARVEVDLARAVADDGVAGPIVERELVGHGDERGAHQPLRDPCHAVGDRRAGRREQLRDFGGADADARVEEQRERLAEHPLDERGVEKLESRSQRRHVGAAAPATPASRSTAAMIAASSAATTGSSGSGSCVARISRARARAQSRAPSRFSSQAP